MKRWNPHSYIAPERFSFQRISFISVSFWCFLGTEVSIGELRSSHVSRLSLWKVARSHRIALHCGGTNEERDAARWKSRRRRKTGGKFTTVLMANWIGSDSSANPIRHRSSLHTDTVSHIINHYSPLPVNTMRLVNWTQFSTAPLHVSPLLHLLHIS